MASEQSDKKLVFILGAVSFGLLMPVLASLVIIKAQCNNSWFSRTLGISNTCRTAESGQKNSSQLSVEAANGKQVSVDLSEMAAFVKTQKGKGFSDFALATEGNNLVISAGGEQKTVDLSNLVSAVVPAVKTTPSKDNQSLSISGKTLTINGGNSIDLSSFLGLADYTAGANVSISGNRVISTSSPVSSTVGDVKSGMQAGDHQGWIKLNGRALSLLTSAQQASAALLGLSGNLPNADSAVLVQNGSSIGTVAGSNQRTIAQNQLPNATLDGTTDLAGGHSHIYDILNMSNNGVFSVFGAPDSLVSGQSSSSTSFVPNHSHTFTTSSLNGGVTQQQLDITPKSLSVNMFIYLGQ